MVEDLATRRTGAPDGPERPDAPAIGVVGTLRWAWRQLTSMRTALFLLMLLAVGAVPGSILPQRGVDPTEVARYQEENPGVSPWLDRLGLFDVYSSVWFSAVYLLLFVSLIGCVLPRAAEHARALRSDPPPAPRNLLRLPDSGEVSTPLAPNAISVAKAPDTMAPR